MIQNYLNIFGPLLEIQLHFICIEDKLDHCSRFYWTLFIDGRLDRVFEKGHSDACSYPAKSLQCHALSTGFAVTLLNKLNTLLLFLPVPCTLL
jgi:hypothetical protein